MKTEFCTLVMLVISTSAYADIPQGPEAVNGSFERMLAHEPGLPALQQPVADRDDAFVERWVNAVARNEFTGPEAGFVHMLVRSREEPRLTVVRAEPDPLATMIAASLELQRVRHERLASASAGRTAP